MIDWRQEVEHVIASMREHSANAVKSYEALKSDDAGAAQYMLGLSDGVALVIERLQIAIEADDTK